MKRSPITLEKLCRFPVKGFSGESLDLVDLTVGEGMPGDRLFGFARFDSGFDPDNPQPLPKDRFVVLANEAGLARLRTSFDLTRKTLTIAVDGQRHRFEMQDATEQERAADFLSKTLRLSDALPPRFVSSMPHRFTDVSVVSPTMMNAVSILNLASVREFEDQIGSKVHPDRFRANAVIDGLPPFSELDAIGSVLTIGDVQFRILSRTKRCAATEVNPRSAARDLKVPYLLRQKLGHMDMGVYAEVIKGGRLRLGDAGHLELTFTGCCQRKPV